MKYGTLGTQKYLNKKGANLVEDGIWGTKTQEAYDLYVMSRRIIMRKGSPWPEERVPQIVATFGPHGVENGYTPPQRLVKVPFDLYLYGNKADKLNAIYCHEQTAASWERAFEKLWTVFERSQVALDATGFTKWFGCYNPRPKRGGNGWSLHAWAIANDFDADNNLFKATRKNSDMPEEIMDILETEYIISLGRYSGYDFGHFQCIKP